MFMFNSKVLKNCTNSTTREHLKMKRTYTYTWLPEVYYKFLWRTLMIRVSNWVFVIFPPVTVLLALLLQKTHCLLSMVCFGRCVFFSAWQGDHTTVRQPTPVQYCLLTSWRAGPIRTRSFFLKGKIVSVDSMEDRYKHCESKFFWVKISTHVINDTCDIYVCYTYCSTPFVVHIYHCYLYFMDLWVLSK